MLINVPEEVAQRLQDLARQEGVQVDELLKQLLNRYSPATSSASLADMAQNAREANLASAQPVDTAEHSREILNTEYAEYLKRRSDHDHSDR